MFDCVILKWVFCFDWIGDVICVFHCNFQSNKDDFFPIAILGFSRLLLKGPNHECDVSLALLCIC